MKQSKRRLLFPSVITARGQPWASKQSNLPTWYTTRPSNENIATLITSAQLRFILHSRLLKLRLHLRLQSSQTVLLPVDELSRFGERRMNGLNLAPHLLADEAVVGVALGHGAELTSKPNRP